MYMVTLDVILVSFVLLFCVILSSMLDLQAKLCGSPDFAATTQMLEVKRL